MGTLSDATDLAREVFTEVSEKNVTFMAAGIAYNAFVSLAPLLVLLFVVVSVVGGGLEQRVVEAAGTWLPGPIADVVGELFGGDAAAGGASVIGLVVLVWGTLKVFRGLDTAFSEIYETEGTGSLADTFTDALVVLVALVVAVVATVGASALFARLSGVVPLAGVLTPLVLVIGLAVALFPVYYVFPDADLEPREVLPGLAFAAVSWAAFQGLFQVYLTFSDPGAAGFFGGVIVVVTYLYFSGVVLLLGAVINAVLGGHASGAPGGVGRGATSYDTEREAAMDRDELAAYLGDLREDLTGRYEGMVPRTGGADRRPRPRGDVTVAEHSATDDGERRWTVTLQWRGTEENADGGAAEEDADETAETESDETAEADAGETRGEDDGERRGTDPRDDRPATEADD